jgi:glycine oxidase
MKSEKEEFDLLIVGGGIAGNTLTLQCIKHGKKVMLIDEATLSLSSKVAAGIWNPIVFKRLTKSYLADELIPYLNVFYKEAEALLQTSFIRSVDIVKFLNETNEIIFWQKKAQGELQKYLVNTIKEMPYADVLQNSDKAYSRVTQSGVLEVTSYINASLRYLETIGSLLREKFDYNLLEIKENHIIYKAIRAKKIVFCEGHLIQKNIYFSYIPMKPVKGEIITIHSEQLQLNEIINKGIFILPLGEHVYKVGATYNWADLNDIPTETGIQQLEENFKKLISAPYTILKKEAGVRPSTVDRRPVLGFHPDYPQLGIFNGFGTKGVMLCPYLSEIFYKFIYENAKLPDELNVRRFQPK